MSVAANPPQSDPFQRSSLRDNLISIVICSGLLGISGKFSKIPNFTIGALYGASFQVANIATRPVFRQIAEYTDRTKTLALSRIAVNLTATALITSKGLEVSVAASAGTMLGLMVTTFVVACGVIGTKEIVLTLGALGDSIYRKCYA